MKKLLVVISVLAAIIAVGGLVAYAIHYKNQDNLCGDDLENE
jgi:uncharacterized protein YxeA